MEKGRCAGRKGWKGQKLSEGGEEQSLEDLECHANEFGPYGLLFYTLVKRLGLYSVNQEKMVNITEHIMFRFYVDVFF